jgi:putative membrane protein
LTAAQWNLATLISLVAVALFYALGLRRLWRSDAGKQTVRPWQAASFTLGCAATGIALLSRLDRWSDILFSAHMAQHEILMLVSAPLMVLGRPFIVTLWSVTPAMRDRVASAARSKFVSSTWERLSGPFTVLLLHGFVLWAWHIPVMFEAALHNEGLHVVQHLLFFLTAALFWWALIHGRYGRLGYGVAVMYIFATAMHTEALGALLTFGSHSWYPTHAMRTAAAGVNAVSDQQFAGIMMWIPFGIVFVLIALGLFAAWLGEAERRVAFTSSEQIVREGRA